MEQPQQNDLYCDVADAPEEAGRNLPENSVEPAPTEEEEASAAPHHKKNFRGYTLEELRYRRAITSLKIDMTTEKLKLLTSPKMQQEVKTVTGYVKGLENTLRYVDYALLAYSVTRRVGNFFRRFGSRKSK